VLWFGTVDLGPAMACWWASSAAMGCLGGAPDGIESRKATDCTHTRFKFPFQIPSANTEVQ
jgi:hypothetical protein